MRAILPPFRLLAVLVFGILGYAQHADATTRGVNIAQYGTDWCRTTNEPFVLLQNEDMRLEWQSDGHLVMYNANNQFAWGTQVYGENYQVCFQTDGNLVIYDENGQWKWQSNTLGGIGSMMVLDRCTLKITDANGGTLWQSPTWCEPVRTDSIGKNWCVSVNQPQIILRTDDAYLTWQDDGHLVLYDRAGNYKWGSQTAGNADQLCFQDDGNLVTYKNGNATWHTALTDNAFGDRLELNRCRLALLGDGNHQIGSKTLWTQSFECVERTVNEVRPKWCRHANEPAIVLSTKDAELRWQSDGHLVLYDLYGTFLWGSQTVNPNAVLCFEDTGNMVIYDGSTPIWQTNTHNAGYRARLVLNGCGMEMFDGTTPIWSPGAYANTCTESGRSVDRLNKGWCRGNGDPETILQSNRAWLAWQADGNLVLYDKTDGSARWTSGTNGNGAHLCHQPDGNLVIYSHNWTNLFHTGHNNPNGLQDTLMIDGCTLKFEQGGWDVSFPCGSDRTAGLTNTWNHNVREGSDRFGLDFGLGMGHQVLGSYSATFGEAVVSAGIFGHWIDIVRADAAAELNDGVEAGKVTFSVLGIVLPATITTTKQDIMTPLQKTFFGARAGFKIGPIGLTAEGSITGTLGALGKLTPQATGMEIELEPYADLDADAEVSFSAACASVSVIGHIDLIDIRTPFTLGVDFAAAQANVVGDLTMSFLAGTIDFSWSACVVSGSWNLASFDGFNPDPVSLVDTTFSL